MTQPIPTQTRHPWRATVRTVVAGALGLCSLLPYVVAEAHVPTEGAVGQALLVTGAITRVMAIPAVNDWITQYLPWLAATPRQP